MDLTNVYKYLMGENEEQRDRLLPALPTHRARGNEHKLKIKHSIYTFFFYCKSDEWNKMPKEDVESPFAEIFKILTL